jgi:hypothetical protein
LISNGFNLLGKLVLCKYGEIFRGNKVKFAEKYGLSGVILFDDPIRAAPSFASNYVYPNGEFLPDTGVQRGSIIMVDGDPETPNYPSNEYAYRSIDENRLPKIPAQVVGYKIAAEIFNLLDIDKSKPVPADWKGELNATYVFGGVLKNGKFLTLNVLNQRKKRKIYNVMSMIRGSIEPDRYVMIGNHRDAWTLGSIDPNSGTTCMLELSRILNELKNRNEWTPKRSIIFFSWDAEEYSLTGSIEFVEVYLLTF